MLSAKMPVLCQYCAAQISLIEAEPYEHGMKIVLDFRAFLNEQKDTAAAVFTTPRQDREDGTVGCQEYRRLVGRGFDC